MRTICEECSGYVAEQEVDFSLHGVSLGKFQAQVCQGCGERVFSEHVANEIDQRAKEQGLWNLGARTKVNKLGSSLAVILNKRVTDFLKIAKGKEVFIYPESKSRLIVEIQE